MKLWAKILIGLLLGVVVGLLMGSAGAYLRPLGTIFLSLINMLVVPLVFASMALGVMSISDPRKLGRVGIKTLLMFLVTTVISIVIALAAVKLLRPGVGVGLTAMAETTIPAPTPIGKLLLNIFPTNPIKAMAEGDMLQVIVFSVFLGIAVNLTGEKAQPVRRFLEGLADVMYRLTNIVMQFAPFGVFGLMAYVAGTFGWQVLLPLLQLLLTNYIAFAVHVGLVFVGILVFLARVKPGPFFKGMSDAIVMAFSTNSSSATLPVSLHCAQENLGVSKNISNFVLPLGSTINMNGAAIGQAIAAVFIAQAYGIELGWGSLLAIIATATISAVGAAGIPGTGFLMLSVVVSSAGLPLEGLALVAGVDRIREMGSTVLNVLGDAVTAVYVAKTEKELNEDQYNQGRLIAAQGPEV
jgi:dicarboxylate/amino acid:cation (Na+ or H+) symporter, DAACS family